jgi:predicted methyltransferase
LENDLRGGVALAHHFLADRVAFGDSVVDATCGNGSDTVFLARLVGNKGRVWAFDVQKEAIERTSRALVEAGLNARTELLLTGHENLKTLVPPGVKAVIFNLGYLPGAVRRLTTVPETTISAASQAVELLEPGGFLLMVIYTGHYGAGDEEKAVVEWASSLSPRSYNVWRHRQLNRSETAPYLLLVERRG